jgi:hypothetical protein
MTGPVEEAGQTARSVVSALGSQPAMLAMVVANFAFLVFIFYALNAARESREKLLNQVFENSREIQQILTKCKVDAGFRVRRPTVPPLPIGEKPPSIPDDPPKPTTSGEHK